MIGHIDDRRRRGPGASVRGTRGHTDTGRTGHTQDTGTPGAPPHQPPPVQTIARVN